MLTEQPREATANRFLTHLRQSTHQYFADLGQVPVNIQLVNEQVRQASILYRFKVSAGTAGCSVLIKVPLTRGTTVRASAATPAGDDRPRLGSITDADSKCWLEYRALSTIQAYFNNLNDPRFGTIRVLDFLPDDRAIIMEESCDPSLNQLVMKASRVYPSLWKMDLCEPFYNTGAWLRAYHALSKPDDVTIRHSRRADFINTINAFTNYLGSAYEDNTFFDKVASLTTTAALEILPQTLPLGLGHGDFAMRNVLVGPNHRITVLDTLARWQKPIYEDIAYFLTAFKFNRLQVFSQGVALNPAYLIRHEQAFLAGYFDLEPVPYSTIRLYEIQALLDKWASIHTLLNQQLTLKRSISGKARLILMNRYFHHGIYCLLSLAREAL